MLSKTSRKGDFVNRLCSLVQEGSGDLIPDLDCGALTEVIGTVVCRVPRASYKEAQQRIGFELL